MASESELLAALSNIFALSDPNLIVGIGDDGAVIKTNPQNLVAATDMAVEGVHFKREWSSLHDIGAKLTAANLADIYAMGGTPKYLLVSAGLTKDFGIPEIEELANGIKSEADLVGVSIVGGDLSSAEKLVISITALGEVEKPITRSGAKVGDVVITSGLAGKSAAGLNQLQNGISDSPFIRAHRKPDVNYKLATKFQNVNSMCDVSDGLLSELNHIASASKVGIEIDVELVKVIPGFEALAEIAGSDIWQWVLTGGEDHIFVATTSAQIPVGAYQIGKVVTGNKVTVPGIADLPSSGFRHF
ncbi:MAG: thiamine-phosphate kinase [Actinomycetales bacterium]|nr:MAG: thiamine-phosphate kinase [Actinomycetales bacterium]